MSDRATSDGREPRGARKKLTVLAVGTLLLVLLLEAGSSILLAWIDAGETGLVEEVHCRYDPDLGWSHVPGFHSSDLYGPGRPMTVDEQGFRRTGLGGSGGRFRIVCLGDSFTLGYGVGDEDTFPSWLERLNPSVQAINMGQGGYGIDQSYLWYVRDGLDLEADLLVLAFIAPDFERMMTDRFQDRYPKPRLVERGGELVAEPEVVPDEWTRPWTDRFARFWSGSRVFETFKRIRRQSVVPPLPEDELAFAPIAERTLAELAELCRSRGQGFCLVQIPMRDRRAGRPNHVSRWMTDVAGQLEIPFFDLTPEFTRGSVGQLEAHYVPDGHLNELGNRKVAELLLERLAELDLELPEVP